MTDIYTTFIVLTEDTDAVVLNRNTAGWGNYWSFMPWGKGGSSTSHRTSAWSTYDSTDADIC